MPEAFLKVKLGPYKWVAVVVLIIGIPAILIQFQEIRVVTHQASSPADTISKPHSSNETLTISSRLRSGNTSQNITNAVAPENSITMNQNLIANATTVPASNANITNDSSLTSQTDKTAEPEAVEPNMTDSLKHLLQNATNFPEVKLTSIDDESSTNQTEFDAVGNSTGDDTQPPTPSQERHWNVLQSDFVTYQPNPICEPRFRLNSTTGTFKCGSKDDVITAGTPCGELLTVNGNCFMHNNGRFDYHQSSEPVVDDDQLLPYCTTFQDENISTFTMSQTGVVTSPHCRYTNLDPRSVLSLFPKGQNTRILLVGASHVRNVFHGFVAGIRGMRNVYDVHPSPDEKGWGVLLTYKVWEDRDEFQMHVGPEAIQNATDKVAITNQESQEESSIEIWSMWAHSFSLQTKVFQDLMGKMRPHMVLNSISSGHENKILINVKWKDTLLEESIRYPPLVFGWVGFWYGQDINAPRRKIVFEMMEEMTHNKVTSYQHLDYKTLLDAAKRDKIVGVDQLEKDWHSACGVYPDFIMAQESWCPDPFDRAFASVFLTLLAQRQRATGVTSPT